MDRKIELSKDYMMDAILKQRLEERFRDGECCEDIAAWFEQKWEPQDMPLLCGTGKKKKKTPQTVGRGPLGEAPDGLPLSLQKYLDPPPTNRGVDFHVPADDSDSLSLTIPAGFVPCPHIMGGYDGGVEVGWDGVWDKTSWAKTLDLLRKAKEAAKSTDDKFGKFFELGGKYFVMSAKSAGGGVTYSFMFEGSGVKFYVHESPSDNGKIQPVRVRYDACGLIGRDLFLKHFETLEFLSSIGFRVSKEKISRVDFQVMTKRSVSQYFKLIDQSKWVCWAHNWQINGKGKNKGAQTWRLGSDIQICMYDKTAELKSAMKKDPVKVALMVQECLGEEWLSEQYDVTRIEFRMKRKALKDFGIDSMEDLLAHEASLVRSLTCSWFRLTQEKAKEGHTHEQAVHPLWREVQELFAQYFPGVDGHRLEAVRDRNREVKADPEALHLQAMGCEATAAAYELGVPKSVAEVVDYVTKTTQKYGVMLFDKILSRCSEIGIKTGLTPFMSELSQYYRESNESGCIPEVFERLRAGLDSQYAELIRGGQRPLVE